MPASDAGRPPHNDDAADLADLIAPADEIFDAAKVEGEIARRIGEDAAPRQIRAETVAVLKDARKAGRARIAEAFAEEPRKARPTVHAYTHLTDGVVRTVLHIAQTRLHRNPNPTEGERIAVLAVGGYGRGEMAPYSDVDLLFLMPWKVTPWAESLIESMLYIFWDLHLKVGHSSRTIKDCLRLGREDYTIRTALLEDRFLDGDEALAEEFSDRLSKDLFRNTAPEFVVPPNSVQELMDRFHTVLKHKGTKCAMPSCPHCLNGSAKLAVHLLNNPAHHSQTDPE